MAEDARQAISALIAGLEEALNVYAAQNQRSVEVKASADATHQRFMALLQSKRSETTSEAASENSQAHEAFQKELLANQPYIDLAATLNLARRWETSLADISEALMQCFAFPELRETAENIAQTIRSVRLLQVADAPPELPMALKSFGGMAEGEIDSKSDQEARDARLDMTASFMSAMDKYREQVTTGFHDRSERTRELLENALQMARMLQGRPGSFSPS